MSQSDANQPENIEHENTEIFSRQPLYSSIVQPSSYSKTTPGKNSNLNPRQKLGSYLSSNNQNNYRNQQTQQSNTVNEGNNTPMVERRTESNNQPQKKAQNPPVKQNLKAASHQNYQSSVSTTKRILQQIQKKEECVTREDRAQNILIKSHCEIIEQ